MGLLAIILRSPSVFLWQLAAIVVSLEKNPLAFHFTSIVDRSLSVKKMDPVKEMACRHLQLNIFYTYLGIHLLSLTFLSIGIYDASQPMVVNKPNFVDRIPGFMEKRAKK